jgi:peptidoglycan/xylan/chitin deacetylase (PgdA/CDA1 family)
MKAFLLIALLTFSVNQIVSAQGKLSPTKVLASRREIAITFDDLPGIVFSDGNKLRSLQGLSTQILSTLVKERVPAIGFVNEQRLYVNGETDARIAILRMWLDSGMTLGNHTFSHLRFYDTTLHDYEDDVIHGEVVTRQLMREKNLGALYFRHPYTNTGASKEDKESFEAFLTERGYRIAPFTIENSDYVFNAVYETALNRKDQVLVASIKASYLNYLDTMCDYFEKRSREVLGYEVKQILLIHANELNAECMDEMVSRLRNRGYAFITLDEALRDEAYKTKDDYVGPMGISWIHRWTVALGQKMNTKDEPDVPQFVLDLDKRRRSN